jgi:hypothetical protein
MKGLYNYMIMFFFVLGTLETNLRDLKHDDLFEIKQKQPVSRERKMLQNAPIVQNKNPLKNTHLEQTPKKKENDDRKLGLSWFDDDEDVKSDKENQNNTKKLMDILKLANTFKNDPNFDVNVHITYRQADNSDHLKKERLLSSKNISKKLVNV